MAVWGYRLSTEIGKYKYIEGTQECLPGLKRFHTGWSGGIKATADSDCDDSIVEEVLE